MPRELLVFPTPGSVALSPNRGIHEQAGGVSNHCFEIAVACLELVKCLQDLKGSG